MRYHRLRFEALAEESSPIAEEFFKALVKRNQDTQNPPRNKLKDAIDYALTRQQL